MSNDLLQTLEAKVDLLIQLCGHLADENSELKQHKSEWLVERARLTEKNELARNRVEAMISRLKKLENNE
jgi:cell division protein ZapB